MNDIKILKKLLELALDRDDFKKHLIGQETNILNHSLKIMMFDKSDSKNHWAKEIHSFCLPITKKQKSDNRYPNKYFYIQHLFEPALETYEEYIDQVNMRLSIWTEEGDDYYFESKKEIRDENHYKKIKNFYEVKIGRAHV